MQVKFTSRIPPLHLNTTAVIVVKPDGVVQTATWVSDKQELLRDCRDKDTVIVVSALPYTIEVFVVSPHKAMERLLDSIPKIPEGHQLAGVFS